MTQDEIDTLWDNNIIEIERMDRDAGTRIKSLLQLAERNGVYVRLSSAAVHNVQYQVAEGDQDLFKQISKSRGIEATDTYIEVPY